MTRTLDSGRSPISMVSFLSWGCSDQAESGIDLPEMNLGYCRQARKLRRAGPALGRQPWETQIMPFRVPLQAPQMLACPLAFRPFWPQIGTGRLAVDEPLANRVRSGRKQPQRGPVRVARQ